MQRLIRLFPVVALAYGLLSCGTAAPTCPPGLTMCGDSCVSLQTDPDHCGTCDTVCGGAAVCRHGACTNVCPVGQALCARGCVDIRNDAKSCGSCDNACGNGQTCVDGTCTRSCTASLTLALPDPWGAMWDGIERPVSSYLDAKLACEGIGGRLPTATELYRVSAAQSGTIGQSYNSNYLWSAVPYSQTNQIILRLSDASSTYSDNSAGTLRPYRCMCPGAIPSSFSGIACQGVPGQECFPLAGGRYNIDRSDRARLSKGAAMWECNFYHAHLADYPIYAQAILSSLPNGSTNWLHTADDAQYDYDTLIKWSNIQPSWVADGNTTVSTMTDFRPFRCVGVNSAVTANPNTVTNEYVGLLTKVKGETMDTAAANFALAHDTCWNRGGHLPRSTELGELVQQGLSGGTNAWLWTSDQEGFNGTQFLVGILRWNGVQPFFGHYYSEFTSWDYKSASYAHRCLYYPLDPQYTPPPATACTGGCFRRDLPGATPATMWMDSTDRTAATLGSAIGICASAGGRLASERDYTEMIRHGLPNGSGSWLLTSDIGYGGQAVDVMVVRWSGTDANFTDQYSTYSTWFALTSSLAFRCVWTNELR